MLSEPTCTATFETASADAAKLVAAALGLAAAKIDAAQAQIPRKSLFDYLG